MTMLWLALVALVATLVPSAAQQRTTLFGCTGGDAVFSIVGPSSGGFVTATLNTLHALALDLETTARPRRLLYYDVTGAGNFVRAVGETGGTWTVAGGATTATTAGSGVLATSSTVSMTSSSLQMGLDAATGDFYIGDTGGVKIRRIKYSNNSIDDYTASSGNAAGPTIDQTARTAIFVGLSTAGLKECKIDVTTLNAVQLSCASITTMTFTKAHAIAHYYSGAGITNRATYIADNGAHVVRVFSNTGSPTLTIGTSGTATSPVGSAPDTVAATATTLNAPTDVQVDPTNGDVYICDTGNNKIRMVSGGNIYTVAGTGTASTTTVTEGSAAASTAISPKKIAIDAARKLLVFSDQNAKRIRGITCRRTNAAGMFYNLTANVNSPCPAGFLCPDGNSAIYAFGGWVISPTTCSACPAGSSENPASQITPTQTAAVTFSPTTSASETPSTSVTASSSRSSSPSPSPSTSPSTSSAPSVTASPTMTPPPGDYAQLFDEDTGVLGLIKGTGEVSSNGQLLACGGVNGNSSSNSNSSSALLFTIFGDTPKAIVKASLPDGFSLGALSLDFPAANGFPRNGRLVFWQGSPAGASSPYSSIRALGMAGGVWDLAGGPNSPPDSNSEGVSSTDSPVRIGAKIGQLSVDPLSGDVVFTEPENGRVRLVTLFNSSNVVTIAGNGQLGNADGPASTTAITSPFGAFFDSSLRGGFTAARVYLSSGGGNYGNNIRELDFGTSPALLSVIAGNNASEAAPNNGYVNGGPGKARFDQPGALTVHEDPATGSRFILVVDRGNNAVRAVLPDGSVYTVVGKGTKVVPAVFSPDGSFVNASTIVGPEDVAVDEATGDLYFIEGAYGVIRMVDSRDGSLRTVVGQPSATVFSSPSNYVEDAPPTFGAAMPRRMSLDHQRRLLVFSDAGIPAIRGVTCRRTNPGGFYFDLASNQLLLCPEGLRCPANNGIIAGFGGYVGNETPLPCPEGLICPRGSADGIPPSSSATPSPSPSASSSVEATPSVSSSISPSASITPSGTPAPPPTLLNCPDDRNTIFTIIGPSADSLVKPSTALNAPHGVVLDMDSSTRPKRFIFGEFWSGNNGWLRSLDTNGVFTTIAGGNGAGLGTENVLATSSTAKVSTIAGIALDSSNGDLYLADRDNNRVRRLKYSTGILETLAGSTSSNLTLVNDGVGTSLPFGAPSGIALDGKTLFMTSSNMHVVRQFADVSLPISSMTLSTLAGARPLRTAGFANGAFLSSTFSAPFGLSFQKFANGSRAIYVAETGNHAVRILRADGQVATLAGNGTAGFFGDGGPASAATLNTPQEASWDEVNQHLYIADTNNFVIRLIDAFGRIYTVAGTRQLSTTLNTPDFVPATQSAIRPNRIFVDGGRKLMIVSDTSVRTVRGITCLRTNPAGMMHDLLLNILVPCAAGYFCPEGNGAIRAFGSFVVAPEACPLGMFCPEGSSQPIIPSETATVTPSPSITPSESRSPSITASETASSSASPSTTRSSSVSASVTPSNSVMATVSPSPSGSPSNSVRPTTSPSTSPSPPWSPPFLNCPDNENFVFTLYGQSPQSMFNPPYSLANTVGSNGVAIDFSSPFRPKRIFFNEAYGNNYTFIRVIEEGVGMYTAVGGTSGTGYAGENVPANRSDVKLASSSGQLAVDPTTGDLYIADTGNHRLRKYDYATRFISTVAGDGTSTVNTLTTGLATATGNKLQNPNGVAVDTTSIPGKTRIYITTSGYGNAIRLLDVATNTLSLFSGRAAGTSGFANGWIPDALWTSPKSLALMTNGTERSIFVSDNGNFVLRKMVPFGPGAVNGTVTTYAGSGLSGQGDNTAALSGRMNQPGDVVIDEFTKDVYIADSSNGVIRMISPLDGKIRSVVGIMNAVSTATLFAENVRATATNASPYRLALDATRKLLIWSDFGTKFIRAVTCKRRNPNGTFFDLLDNTLKPCPAGLLCGPDNSFITLFGLWTGQNAPPPCVGGAGRFCPPGAGAEAPLCPPGFYCPEPYLQPSICPAGFMCPGGITTPIRCTFDYQCPEGSAFPANITASATATPSPAAESPTPAASPSTSASQSVSRSASASTSASQSASRSASASTSASQSASRSASASTAASPSETRSVAASRSPTDSGTPSQSQTPSNSPSTSVSPSNSPSTSVSPSNPPSTSVSPSVSASVTATPTSSPPVRNDAGLPAPVVWLTFDAKLVPDKFSAAPDALTSGGFTGTSGSEQTTVSFGADRGGNPASAVVLGSGEGAADVLVSNGIPSGTPFGASPRTVALWVKLSSYEAFGNPDGSVLFSYGASAPFNNTANGEWKLHIRMIDKAVQEETRVLNERGEETLVSTTRVVRAPCLMIGDLAADPSLNLPLNRWFHVAASYSGDGMAAATRRLQSSGSAEPLVQGPPFRRSLFFNGALVGQDQSDHFLSTEPSPITIGPLRGSVDEVSILAKPLAVAEVQSVYTASPGEFSRPLVIPPSPSPSPAPQLPQPRRPGASLVLPIQLAGASLSGLVSAREEVLAALRADLSRALGQFLVDPSDIDINWCASRIADLFPVLNGGEGGAGFSLGIGCAQPEIPGCSASQTGASTTMPPSSGASRRALSHEGRNTLGNGFLPGLRRRSLQFNGTAPYFNSTGSAPSFNETGSGPYSNGTGSNTGSWDGNNGGGGNWNGDATGNNGTDWVSFYYGGESYHNSMNEQPWVILQVSLFFPKAAHRNDVFAAKMAAQSVVNHIPSLFADHIMARQTFARTAEVASRLSSGRTVTPFLDATVSAEGAWIGAGQQGADVDALLDLAFSTEVKQVGPSSNGSAALPPGNNLAGN